MLVYLVRRVFATVIVCFLVITFVSLLVHIVPGDPAKIVLGPRASPELIARVRTAMDLDQPLLVQVGRFFWNLLHGDLGVDVFNGLSINGMIARALPHTIILAVSSLGLAVAVGIPLGMYSATHPNSWAERVLAIMSISFITIPSYVAGLFLLLVFAERLKWLPAVGVGKPGDVLDYLAHLILPVVALALGWVGYLARLVRSSLLEVLNETHILAARSAGIPGRTILYKYALKNALISTVAVLGVGLGQLMAGAVFIETIFSRPGLGTLITGAIQNRNYPIVRAGTLVIALLFVFVNLLADLAYTYLDPRIQLGKEQR